MTVDPYAVTAQEAVQYDKFCRHHLAYLNRYPPDSLWHYTTAATFAMVMESKKLWATQISCLNDHMEFRHGVRLVRDAIGLYKLPPHDADTRWLAGYVDEGLENDGADVSEFFVLCMSEAKDDLSQWRAYAGGENGVALELCTPVLQPDTQHGGHLRPVCYIENAQKGLAADIAKWTIDFFRLGFNGERTDRKRWADAFLEAWRHRIVWFAPLLKDTAFAAEREWRLIVSLGSEDLKNVEIRQRQSLISRHIPLSFGPRVPLKSVMVGPCRNPNVSRVSVGTILEAKGYPIDKFATSDPNRVQVTNSKVPFQTT